MWIHFTVEIATSHRIMTNIIIMLVRCHFPLIWFRMKVLWMLLTIPSLSFTQGKDIAEENTYDIYIAILYPLVVYTLSSDYRSHAVTACGVSANYDAFTCTLYSQFLSPHMWLSCLVLVEMQVSGVYLQV